MQQQIPMQQTQNSLLNGKLSDDLARQMYESNPQFRNFVDQNKKQGPRAMLKNMGIDANQLLSYAQKFLG